MNYLGQVYPIGTDVVLCVGGLDVLGKPLNEDHVCRADLVSKL